MIGSKGTGLWSVQEAMGVGEPVPSLSAAVTARQMSMVRDKRLANHSSIGSHCAPRVAVGNPLKRLQGEGAAPPGEYLEDLYWATYLAIVASDAQRFAAIRAVVSAFNLEISPNLLVAKLGSAWAISKMVPLWHVPMMNESHRNDAYYAGIKTAVKPGKLVLEIGAGSGLLSMMAAKVGATEIVACEAEPLVAKTATDIVNANGFADQVTILSKISYDVELGKDLPEKADVLIHEIFDSAIIGEHVLPAIEDAKKRLLKPDALIVPHAASIMIALMGGEAAGQYLRVESSHGFDLSRFNLIASKKIPFYREDIALTPMSAPVDAFRFDFMNQDAYPAEDKILALTATTEGLCYGVVQWIRLELDATTVWENNPTDIRSTTAWQRTVYRFDQPLQLTQGMVVKIAASHDRASPWFDLAQ
jgi:type II protein arginine methyltransferase